MQLYQLRFLHCLRTISRPCGTKTNVVLPRFYDYATTCYRNASQTVGAYQGLGWHTSFAIAGDTCITQLSVQRWQLNQKRGPKLVKPKDIIRFWKIRIGDKVEVISGKEKGKVGEVLACDKLRNQVKVKGCNMRKLVVDGRVLHIEKKIHYSNVQLVDPLMNCPTRVTIRYNKQNEPLRVSKKSGYIIPWPEEKPEEEEEIIEGEKDTAPEVAAKRTYDYEADLKSMERLRQVMKKYNRDIE